MPSINGKMIHFLFLNSPPIALGSSKERPLQNTSQQTSLLARVFLHHPGDLGLKPGHPHFCSYFSRISVGVVQSYFAKCCLTDGLQGIIRSKYFLLILSLQIQVFFKYLYLSNPNSKFSMLDMKIAHKILQILNIMLSSMLIIFKIIFMLHP